MDSPLTLTLTLTGDDNTPAISTTNAQVNHLRRLLAWMRCGKRTEEQQLLATRSGQSGKTK